jgi:hypothetical protein
MRDAATKPEKEVEGSAAAESGGEDQRLEVFKDFVDTLDLDDIDSSDTEPDE